MNDLGIIDRFMDTFSRYIDSGFGLLSGDVAFLSTILIGIDITLAGLFWALGGEDNVIARLIKKVLYVGVFAYIMNNFQNLANIIYNSFAGLGLTRFGQRHERRRPPEARQDRRNRLSGVPIRCSHQVEQSGRLPGLSSPTR